jgi:hypothetical protein
VKKVRFNDALRRAAEATQLPTLPSKPIVGLIRDVYGRIRFAIDAESSSYPPSAIEALTSSAKTLGGFSAPGGVLFRDDFTDASSIFAHKDWHETLVPGIEGDDGIESPEIVVRLLDRQIIGQDWLHTEQVHLPNQPPRIVFYGLKGGVGRSTALAMLAYRLARNGKRVLLLDFDLESPGLSGLLLPPDRIAPYGLVDWFVEEAIGQSDGIALEMVSDSPLADNATGSIRVVAAMGQGEQAYLAKLARVYADVPKDGAVERFATRMRQIVELLEVQEKPDIVLIDSRAGLNDLAAISIAGLATIALLFAIDGAQNWQGYRQLFSHWQSRPNVLRRVRERLAIVQALFPESDQAMRAERFLQHSYELFSTTLYDAIEPGKETPIDAFAFDLDSEEAPHFPLRVRWNARFQEFDPLLSVEKGGIGDADIDSAFGPFFEQIVSMVFEE